MERDGMTPAGLRLLDAAGELFYRDGINTVGVATIAESAGVTKKTLYECFGAKSGLVAAYLRDRHEKWWGYLERRLARARGSRVLVVFDVYSNHPELDHARGCGFLNGAAELAPSEPGFEVIREHKNAVRGRLAELVRQEYPGLDPVEPVAEHLFLILEGAVAQSGIDGTDDRLRIARKIAQSVLDQGRAGL